MLSNICCVKIRQLSIYLFRIFKECQGRAGRSRPNADLSFLFETPPSHQLSILARGQPESLAKAHRNGSQQFFLKESSLGCNRKVVTLEGGRDLLQMSPYTTSLPLS